MKKTEEIISVTTKPPRTPWGNFPDVLINVMKHTGADGFSRLARQAEFASAIQTGCEYVLVDDSWAWGGRWPT